MFLEVGTCLLCWKQSARQPEITDQATTRIIINGVNKAVSILCVLLSRSKTHTREKALTVHRKVPF